MARKPKPLRKGACVRIVAPSSPFERSKLMSALPILKGMGLIPNYSERVFESFGYLAGRDEGRLRELVEALSSGEAVFAVRGGYGAMRLLEGLLEHKAFIKDGLFMGFSDITALHLFLLKECDLVTFHGPNVNSLARLDEESLRRVEDVLFGRQPEKTFTYASLGRLFGGVARGRIVVGNLSLITSMIGTRWEAPLRGTILIVEDVGEPLYRIDRMLTQLSLQEGFDEVAGLAFGDLGPKEEEGLEALLAEFARRHKKPAVYRFPIGHGSVNYPVPEGVEAVLDADLGVLRVVESPYREG